MREDPIRVESICIVCGRNLRRFKDRETIGFCPSCAGKMGLVPIEDLRGLSSEEVDCLPLGFIGLDHEGYVVRFNSYEVRASGQAPQSVLGRHFFREVAPCAAVKSFEGRYDRMVRQGLPTATSFRYLFRFASGERLVKVFLSYRPDKGEGLVILRELEHL